ncbi:autophagy-related protein 11-domain-containing protein [Dichotomopilus funicola]|uniref:Autophagy-related protein 11 n=1 Tax=Dichotomopilus funicola TaxID=1934379 RepID=A0AAN6ZMD3_9PEZI|nr:autophagy-related protein 11-domain-containing protein [Dichotomopilus funicola]
MATQVLIAHTGQCLRVDVSQLTSLDDFKSLVARHVSIPAQCIITLTPQGKPLKLQTIQLETEIFVYDNRLAQPLSTGASPGPNPELQVPKPYIVENPPNSIGNSRSVQAWQELFKVRREWAVGVVEDCRRMAEDTEERYREMDVMMRCLDAAEANLESVIKSVEPRYAELRKWLPEARADYTALTAGWEQYLSFARSIPVSPIMVRFMTRRDLGDANARAQRKATLEDLVNLEMARRTGGHAAAALRNFNTRAAALEKAGTRLFHDAEDVFREYERIIEHHTKPREGDPQQLVGDIEALATKIGTDYETTLGYANSSRDAVVQASKLASNHTERLLPSMSTRALEMDEMLRYATQARNLLAVESLDFMRGLTNITALSHTVKSQLNGMHQEEEFATFDYLRLIQQVPYMYASFVAEAIKRREWFDKMKQDSSTLANEAALFQEEEVKRRRRWYKSIDKTYGPESLGLDSAVPGLEVNLHGEEERWPSTTYEDLEEFRALLQAHKVDPRIAEDIEKMASEMGKPTRQQSKRMKAFKNGSVHEAALGRSALLIRGDDDLLHSLQDDKIKLESKLKTAESRVRRLEDLLHRQTQASRPSLGNLFHAPSQQFSDRVDSTISVKSPVLSEDRRGSAEGTDILAQRVQHLEEQLAAEKERSAALEKDLDGQAARFGDVKGQVDEANSTKKDLLENLEALKREFTEERRSLEGEIKRLQARLEDTEDEIDHFGESRENEKVTFDETIRALRFEVERLTKEKHDETLKSDGKLNFLREETRLHRETLDAQEVKLQAAQGESRNLRKQLDAMSETTDVQSKALHELWEQVSLGDPAPDDLSELVDELSIRVGDAVARARSLDSDTSLLRSELESAQSDVKSARAEQLALAERLSDMEAASIRSRETVAEERAKVAALERELVDGREQLSRLRITIADGETGSESLRKQLEEEETKIALVTEELASRQSHVGSLEEEVQHIKGKLQYSQGKLSDLTALFDMRSVHAKDLTQRLYSQNERLIHLLDRLGFSVTRQDGSTTIQKVPRSERSSQNANDSDPGSSLRRSGTLSSRAAMVSSADLNLLDWVSCSDTESELGRYQAYISTLGSLDMDAVGEAVYRRVRDVEHLARKLQRDARAYRDKARALQKEAHEKIAFKNFKEGDLALFLPTRNQTTGAWAAFNVGFPHYFLREQETHRLRNREWLLARISRVQERVVDLSKSLKNPPQTGKKTGGAESESLNEDDNDNPFDLSDGLRWYLLEAAEDKPGAPSTPGLAKSTVAANNVEAVAERPTQGRGGPKGGVPGIRGAVASGIEGVSKTLSKSLESRRSSTSSRKALPFAGALPRSRDSAVASETNSLRAAPVDGASSTSPAHHDSPQPPRPTDEETTGGTVTDLKPADPRSEQQPPQPQRGIPNDIDHLIGP